jgi:hypothetical protein
MTDAELARVERLEKRVAALEEMFEVLMILERAKQRARERASGTDLRPVPDR